MSDRLLVVRMLSVSDHLERFACSVATYVLDGITKMRSEDPS